MNTTREGHAFTLTNFGHGLPTCLLKAERCPTTINRYIFADQICFHAVPKKISLKEKIRFFDIRFWHKPPLFPADYQPVLLKSRRILATFPKPQEIRLYPL